LREFAQECDKFISSLDYLDYDSALSRWEDLLALASETDGTMSEIDLILDKVAFAFDTAFESSSENASLDFESYDEEQVCCPCCYSTRFFNGYCEDCEDFVFEL